MTDIIRGTLYPYSETGTEGIVWSLREYGKKMYDGLHCLKQGDFLSVCDPTSGSTIWSGNIDYDYKSCHTETNNTHGQAIFGTWVNGVQKFVNHETWATWFLEKYPAYIIKSGIGKLYPCESSLIESIGWHTDGSDFGNCGLVIKFKNGEYYRYKGVRFSLATSLMEASSKGKFFIEHINRKFEYEKIILPRG